MDLKDSVQRQFGSVAASYSTSAVHIGGPDLSAMLAAVVLRGDQAVLDAGCGTGHTALAFAPQVGSVVGVDLTQAMLDQAELLAAERRIGNVRFERGDVEQLPFADGQFDIVTSRYSAHHYLRPLVALREFARVLKPGGSLLLVDVVAPEEPLPDTFLNAIEILRDPSHVRDHRVTEWQTLFGAAGLRAEVRGMWPLRLEFGPWVRRMRTSDLAVAQIRSLMDGAQAEVRVALGFEPDYNFHVPITLLQGVCHAEP